MQISNKLLFRMSEGGCLIVVLLVIIVSLVTARTFLPIVTRQYVQCYILYF